MSFLNQNSLYLTKTAQESILYEAVLQPKPGLVDSLDTGAHQDMDIFTFINSSSSLFAGFYEFAEAGRTHEGTLDELFQTIRPIGIVIEKDMLDATDQVNTHKGAIFSFGIFLAALGYYGQNNSINFRSGLTNCEINEVFDLSQKMTQKSLLNDFNQITNKSLLTNGEKLYVKHGLMGIRGEAINGYPVIRDFALPYFRKLYLSDLTTEEILLKVLLLIMSKTEDSNVINRGGINALSWVQTISNQTLQQVPENKPIPKEKLRDLNQLFINDNLSPGGAADLLALTIFLNKIEKT